MRILLELLVVVTLLTATRTGLGAEASPGAPPKATGEAELPKDYSCLFCHDRKSGSLVEREDAKHLLVSAEDLAGDIHWQKGIRCHDCHGGNPVQDEYIDHRKDEGFRSLQTPDGVAPLCGKCHSDIEYMRRFQPSPRIDQEREYWTSGHGQRLKKAAEEHKQALENVKPGEEEPPFPNPRVATCVSCHSAERKHNILAVKDQKSSVFPTHVAETCAKCHSDEKLMAGRMYHGRPLGHNQYELWKQSVHAETLLKKGDLSAATCNSCHGNHGALPPDVDSVANACGKCHGKVAGLFAKTAMKHRFEKEGLPGCVTCHSNHQIALPSDAMLGMEQGAVCVRCHEKNQHGATLAGADAARKMRADLEDLKQQIADAEDKLDEAERLGMEVRGPRFDLRQARDALTNSRAQIHTFSLEAFETAVAEGVKVISKVQAGADAALKEYTRRRVWLAASLVPLLIVVVLLLLYIRALPIPAPQPGKQAH
jgi:predicted CXXCH cytochrome family protein